MQVAAALQIPQMQVSRSLDAGQAARAAIREAICEITAGCCAQRLGSRLRAIALTGSLARDEATLVAETEAWRVLGDAEFLVILRGKSKLPGPAEIHSLCGSIETALETRRIHCPISIGAAHATYLRCLHPSIFAYELKSHGRVIRGEQSILSLIPPMSAASIPLDDAFRLLCNRMTEQLEDVEAMAGPGALLPSRVHYRTAKLYLDMATSLLIFKGAYAPAYGERSERLLALAGTGGEWPFAAEAFASDVARCTRWKLTCSPEDSDCSFEFWGKAASYAAALWRWEAGRLLCVDARASNQMLAEEWMRRQPASSRVKGWAYAIRRRLGHGSMEDYLRWLRQAWKTSPRGYIYAAACELFCELPALVAGEKELLQPKDHWEQRAAGLPVCPDVQDPREWRKLATAIVWNYNEFLLGNRA